MTYEPINAVTRRPYNSGNVELLRAAASRINGLTDPRWLTFLQAKRLGLKVKKGEHGTRILYCVTKDTESDKQTEKKSFVRRSYVVFHASQVEGITEYKEDAK